MECRAYMPFLCFGIDDVLYRFGFACAGSTKINDLPGFIAGIRFGCTVQEELRATLFYVIVRIIQIDK